MKMMPSQPRFPSRQIAPFCRRWQVQQLAVFGSAARGDETPSSDVDVLVTFKPEAAWSLFDLVDMRDELSRIFHCDVDLVEEKSLRNPFLRKAVLRDKLVLHDAG
jgi:predicted nucleotidyltransferase